VQPTDLARPARLLQGRAGLLQGRGLKIRSGATNPSVAMILRKARFSTYIRSKQRGQLANLWCLWPCLHCQLPVHGHTLGPQLSLACSCLVTLQKNYPLQNDAYGEDIRGYTEYLGVTLIKDTELVGVQRSKTTMSEIVSDKTGQPIKVSTEAAREARPVIDKQCQQMTDNMHDSQFWWCCCSSDWTLLWTSCVHCPGTAVLIATCFACGS